MHTTRKNDGSQIEQTTARDAQLRLDQMKEGKIPSKNTPTLANPMYRKAYDGFLRYGGICNTLREGTDGAGGYLVPDEFEKKLIDALREKNVLRRLASVKQTHRDLKIPYAVGSGHAFWVPEEGDIPETSDEFGELQIGAHKLATMTVVSEELLEDSGFDIEDFLAKEFAYRIGREEEEAFLDGDGRGKPLGLLRQLDRVVISENPGHISMDDVIDLQHAIPMPYRKNAVFLMSEDAGRELRKIRTVGERNIWEGDMCRDMPVKLLGVPVIICDSLPGVESGSIPLLYGDFSRILIGDRNHRSIRRLNELYARYGQVAYTVSQRVDSVLLDKRAIGGLKVQ